MSLALETSSCGDSQGFRIQPLQKMGAEHWGWVREPRAKLLGYEVREGNCHNLAPLKELMAVTAVFASQTLLESFRQALRIKCEFSSLQDFTTLLIPSGLRVTLHSSLLN